MFLNTFFHNSPADDSAQPSHGHWSAWRVWLFVALWMAATPLAAQPVRTEVSIASAQPDAASATAVCATRCPSGEGVLPRAADGAAPLERVRRDLGSPDRLSLRAGRVIERGIASWYGARFHGRTTASGEIFDKDEFTAAHKTLPFGTRVWVRNPRTGRQVLVRINDRGPFASNRVIDLSTAAARALGLKARGFGAVVLREAIPADHFGAVLASDDSSAEFFDPAKLDRAYGPDSTVQARPAPRS